MTTAVSGDQLYGLAADLMALAAVIGAWRGSSHAKGAKTAAEGAEAAATESLDAVGPANGETIRQLLDELRTHSDYQHQRNHDILNELTAIRLAVGLPPSEVAKAAQRAQEPPR